MRRMGILLVVLLLVPGCTGDDDPEPSAEEKGELFVYASERLTDELLEEAAPAGFEVTRVVRHGPEQTANPWVTVGARMEGPVDYARAIFYVHADEKAAVALNERQVEMTESRYDSEVEFRPRSQKDAPAPFVVAVDGTRALCGTRFDGLFWCHAQKGRLYLLIQSSAGRFGERGTVVTDEQVDAARTVTAAFMELL